MAFTGFLVGLGRPIGTYRPNPLKVRLTGLNSPRFPSAEAAFVHTEPLSHFALSEAKVSPPGQELLGKGRWMLVRVISQEANDMGHHPDGRRSPVSFPVHIGPFVNRNPFSRLTLVQPELKAPFEEVLSQSCRLGRTQRRKSSN